MTPRSINPLRSGSADRPASWATAAVLTMKRRYGGTLALYPWL